MDLAALFARFKRGQVYVRRQVHDLLGGQEQGGISTPRNAPAILLFSTEQGAEYGYKDGWRADGFYHYTGEGQSGDMKMIRGNRAIRDHQEENKVLMLFEGVGSGLYRFGGFMNCVDYYEKDTDALGSKRRVFVFRLIPIESITNSELPKQTEVGTTFLDLRPDVLSIVSLPVSDKTNYVLLSEGRLIDEETRLKDLHIQIPLVHNDEVKRGVTPQILDYGDNSRAVYQRRVEILQNYVLERANGFCELCGHPAPFVGRNGSPYLEVHYIDSVSDYGLSEPNTLIALCPACHKEAHYGALSASMATRLYTSAADIEDSLDKGMLKIVTAAIIRDDECRILAAQRARGEFAGCWEFPGGQVKKGETLKQCLGREISEELTLEIQGLTPFLKVDYDYETFYIRLYSFTCKAKGVVALHDHSQIRWMKPQDLTSLDWVPADEGIVGELVRTR